MLWDDPKELKASCPPATSASRSFSEKRRWPPAVRIALILPLSAQTRSVAGCTPSMSLARWRLSRSDALCWLTGMMFSPKY